MKKDKKNPSQPLDSIKDTVEANRPGSMGRRGFLRGTMATGALLASAGLMPKKAKAADDDCGVASGDPSEDSVVLWTRVPERFQAGPNQTVQWQVATTDDFDDGDMVETGVFTTSAERDYTVKFKVSGLAPFTHYYYRFFTESGYESVVGRTLTAPADGEMAESIRIGFVACSNLNGKHWNVMEALSQDELHYCAHLGDNIYEHALGYKAQTLDDFRGIYKKYLKELPSLREARRLFPWVYVWDDHETYNNYAGGSPEMTPEERSVQDAGYNAFYEYMTVDTDIVPSTADGITEYPIYRNLKFGRLLEIFAVDGRQYRDDLVCGRDILVSACDDLYDENRTNLGHTQTEWLKSALKQSDSTWKLVLNQTMMMALKVTSRYMPIFDSLSPLTLGETSEGMVINLDQWDGYPANRADILGFVESQDIDNVVVLTGDIHNCYAGELRSDFTRKNSKTCGVEFVVGSVTSSGIAETMGGFDLTGPILKALKPANPHMKWLDAYYHAYGLIELSPTQCAVTYMAVDTITSPEYELFELQRLTVPAGQSTITVEG